MPFYQGNWPLPDVHPFKGTRIIFGMKRPDSSAKSSTPEKEMLPDDPKEQRLKDQRDDSFSPKPQEDQDPAGPSEPDNEPQG